LFIYAPPRLLSTSAHHNLLSESTQFHLASPAAKYPKQVCKFSASSVQGKSEAVPEMEDFEDSLDQTFDDMADESDVFTPVKPVKKTAATKKTTATKNPTIRKVAAPKKTAAAAAKTDKPKTAAKPKAKKAVQPPVEVEDETTMDIDHQSFDVLETPQLSSDSPSPARPAVLQETNVTSKNASQTYQKVRPTQRDC